MKKVLFFISVVMLLASCGRGSKIQYIPFQEDKDGSWGLISTSGDVLFSDEFKEEPTVAMHDRFFAKNKDGKWELYSTEKNPEQIGHKEYDEAGAFIENVAPVVASGKRIQFIDKNGDVQFELEKAGGKPIEECTNFSEGVAIIKTSEGYGCINTKGEVIVEPKYAVLSPASDGKIVGIKNKYKNEDKSNYKVTVLSTKGEEISEFSLKKFSDISGTYHDGVMIASEKSSDDEVHCCLIDQNGDYVVKPSSKVNYITAVKGDKFIFTDGDDFGLMNIKGDIILRAKYTALAFSGKDGLYYANTSKDKPAFELINEQGDKISKDEYENALSFYGSLSAVKENDHSWIFINDKGEDQDIKTDIYNIDDEELGDVVFHSQYGTNNESDDSNADADVDSIAADSAAADSAVSYTEPTNENSAYSAILTGYVGNYPITMSLEISNDYASGWYYYNKYQSQIAFTGSVSGNTVELNCEGGDHFYGTLSGDYFSGNFISNTGKEYSFSVSR